MSFAFQELYYSNAILYITNVLFCRRPIVLFIIRYLVSICYSYPYDSMQLRFMRTSRGSKEMSIAHQVRRCMKAFYASDKEDEEKGYYTSGIEDARSTLTISS